MSTGRLLLDPCSRKPVAATTSFACRAATKRTILTGPASRNCLSSPSASSASQWSRTERIRYAALRRWYSDSPPPPSIASSHELGHLEPRLSLTFTCTVPDCGHRSSHTFTKRAYEKGIVIVACPGCKNRHLIADHLSWFKDERTQDGKLRTIEDIMKAKGETVQRGRVNLDDSQGGTIEWTPDEEGEK
ncbi:zf-DNL-domain-containing protein [Heliocybe sulcata]|uniref:Zf-DNL-domain-containing protein n=1 Tax=Heliocybe sulcata TaxID=5364 RepID=A0A5C3N665_9AGAM|nr:zf-DNL-domain-containing protein [Heliocybe sulcata]